LAVETEFKNKMEGRKLWGKGGDREEVCVGREMAGGDGDKKGKERRERKKGRCTKRDLGYGSIKGGGGEGGCKGRRSMGARVKEGGRRRGGCEGRIGGV